MSEKKSIGTIELYDQFTTRKVEITDWVRSAYKDHRLCTVIRTEEGNFVLSVENPSSSGRAAQSNMHLTEDSMLAMMSCIFIYYEHQGIDITQRMSELVNGGDLSYEYSMEENLNPEP